MRSHVIGDALVAVGDGEPVDALAFAGAGAGADVVEAVLAELCGLEALVEESGHDVVCEELHTTVGVVDHKPLGGAEELVGDHEGADRVIARSATSVADHVGIAFAEARVFGGVEAGVHAGENREASRGRKREIALGAERAHILGVGRENLVEDRHPELLDWKTSIP